MRFRRRGWRQEHGPTARWRSVSSTWLRAAATSTTPPGGGPFWSGSWTAPTAIARASHCARAFRSLVPSSRAATPAATRGNSTATWRMLVTKGWPMAASARAKAQALGRASVRRRRQAEASTRPPDLRSGAATAPWRPGDPAGTVQRSVDFRGRRRIGRGQLHECASDTRGLRGNGAAPPVDEGDRPILCSR